MEGNVTIASNQANTITTYHGAPGNLCLIKTNVLPERITVSWDGRSVDLDGFLAFFEKAAATVCASPERQYEGLVVEEENMRHRPITSNDLSVLADQLKKEQSFRRIDCYPAMRQAEDAPVLSVMEVLGNAPSLYVMILQRDFSKLEAEITDFVLKTKPDSGLAYEAEAVRNVIQAVGRDIQNLLAGPAP